MSDIILDVLKDSFKLLPFLFITFLILELIEHNFGQTSKNLIQNTNKIGPLLGSLLGAIPQCGFSAAASNLYTAKVITIGTLISIYLSTSDEMLPILISNHIPFQTIALILIIKIIIALISGFAIDLFHRNNHSKISIDNLCKKEHCHCEKGLFKSTIIHTLNVFIFILIVNFSLTTAIEYLGIEKLSSLFVKNNILSSFLAALIGLIPNCASSVLLTELYLSNIITLGSLISGLLAGSGIGLLILFKTNKNLKENFKVLTTIYLIGSLSGIIIDLLNITL